MTVAVNLPRNVEQAYLAAARMKGVSIDVLAADVLVAHVPVDESPQRLEPIEEHGIPAPRTGQPLDHSVVSDAIAMIRRERDLSVPGHC
jgi:hypothetical protein